MGPGIGNTGDTGELVSLGPVVGSVAGVVFIGEIGGGNAGIGCDVAGVELVAEGVVIASGEPDVSPG
jgi:hypothetical protein